MAGLEVVVRPVIFPDIRPRARQSLPPQDDPDKGFAVIKGQPAQGVGISYSMSISSSKEHQQETERRVDVVRVYQEEEDGTINKQNYVDMEVANRITTTEPGPEGAAPRAPGDPSTPWNQVSEIEKKAYYKKYEEWEEEEKRKMKLLEQDKIIKAKKGG